MNHLSMWDEGPSDNDSRSLRTPQTVIGECLNTEKSEYAKIQLTVSPAEKLEIIDRVEQKSEVERLEVDWPHCVILGLSDLLKHSLGKMSVTLELVWYHDRDSTRNAFREAGRDAGRKILATLERETST
jgi:hypothetical protein